MTLITNEIHIIQGFRKTSLVFAADRRITNLDGTFAGNRRKLFRIPYLEAGLSYFGLAVVFPGGRRQYLSDWLPTFITRVSHLREMRDFAFALRDELNSVVPAKILEKHPSGFHLCGYNSQGIPDFWFITNIGGMNEFAHTNLKARYADPTSDFLCRDAKQLGWDGTNLDSVGSGKCWIYRNGDYRAHAYLWGELDRFFSEMRKFPDFRRLYASHEEWVRFKFEVIAHFYKRFAKRVIIGRPIDVFTLSKSQGVINR